MVFSLHAAERWQERFSHKDFNLTVSGMCRIRANKLGQNVLRNNGVIMIEKDGIVITVY